MSVFLRTITLASAPFSLEPGAAQRSPESSRDFWQAVASSVEGSAQEKAATVVVEHAGVRDEQGHYATLSEDSLEHPPQLLTVRLQREAAPLKLPEGCQLMGAELRIFDHEVTIIETVLDIGGFVAAGPFTDERAVELETLAHEVGAQLCRGIGEQWCELFSAAIGRHDPKQEFVRDIGEPEAPALDMLWTSRGLFASRSDADALAASWLREADSDSTALDELLAGEREHVASWLNYIFLDDDPLAAATLDGAHSSSEVWAGLRYAQYFYASLEQVDTRLGDVLAQTHGALKGAELAALRDELTEASHAADLIIIERQRTEKYLRRSVRRHMQDILAGWDTEELVEEPVRHKATLCAQRVAAIEGDLSRQAGVWTDLILLGIAVTSILGTALTVVSFGRQLGSDSGMAGYDSGASGIIEWLASQPADAVLLTSLIVSASLALIYVLYRRSSQS